MGRLPSEVRVLFVQDSLALVKGIEAHQQLKRMIMLETRRICLREITSADWSTIFAWRNTENFRYFVPSNDEVVTYPEFCEEFAKASAVRLFQFLVEKRTGGQPVGFAYVHSVSEERSHCFVNIFMSEPYVGHGYAVDVFLLIARLMLTQTTLHRVYAQAFSYNTMSLSALSARIPEAATEQRREHKGKEYSYTASSVTHEHMDRISRLLDLLCRPKRA